MCDFNQAYGEGSSYSGFLARDTFYFGSDYHVGDDAFDMTFGCVTQETHLFYTQEADGILGLTKSNSATSGGLMKPIFEQMADKGVIDQKTFTLCLGKNGGYFQVGGFDLQGVIPRN